jgi:hypothetical protein
MKKKNRYLLLVSLTVILISAKTGTEFPEANISNGIIHARFYLPDAEKGFYRGTRFDWSGVIPNLEFNGHTFCAKWFDNYNATTHEDLMGPVESFSPLGYDEAKAGGRFVEIGVGMLSKINNDTFTPYTYYPILNNGTWKVKTKPASIEFMHTLEDSLYSYQYKKTETLVKGKAILILTHSLKNTGKKTIETDVYNHNMFVFDKQLTGAGFVVTFPFNPILQEEERRGFGQDDIAIIKENQIVFNKAPEKNKSVYSILKGYNNASTDYNIKIENHKTGAAVKITGDQPLSKLIFWGSVRIFSPEPYILINVPPGKTFNWKITYEFYNCSILY